MIVKDLYNPMLGGQTRHGFIQACNSFSPFGSFWLGELGASGAEALDNYIRIKIGKREVSEDFEEKNEQTFENLSYLLYSYNYQLDGLYRLMIANDSSENGYNPLDNVNEVRHEVTEMDFDKGSQTNKLNGGERETSVNNPSYTDTITNENETSAFDSVGYDKDTTKNTQTNSYGANTVVSSSDSFTDSSEEGARHDDTKTVYDVKRHGNIGVTTSFELISGDRKVHYYNFFDEVVKILIDNILKSCLWGV